MTDLVFIDPVNTGYSRAATPEQAREFFGVREDISSVADFIRLYLTKNQRWGSPVFLAGESYGTTRAAGLAEHLQDRTGVAVSGVILISTVLSLPRCRPVRATTCRTHCISPRTPRRRGTTKSWPTGGRTWTCCCGKPSGSR